MTQRMIQRCQRLLAKPFFHDRRTILALWLLLSLVGMLKLHRSDNNFLIFRGVFWHTIQGLPLYEAYPAEYFDVNHYGPLFSLVIAPFAVMPVGLGLFFWLVALSLTLYFAIRCSGLTDGGKLFVFWFCSETLLTSLFMQQFNIAIAAIIIATFFLVERERDFWAACLIVVGTLVKLYGIVGLAFFLLSRHKVRFTLSLVFWAVVLFAAPMLISSPQYVVGQYGEWVACLGGKNVENIHSIAQNISALGLVRRITGNTIYSDLWLILPALTVFFLPYLRGQRVQFLHHRTMRNQHLVCCCTLEKKPLGCRSDGFRLSAVEYGFVRPLPTRIQTRSHPAIRPESSTVPTGVVETLLGNAAKGLCIARLSSYPIVLPPST